MRTVIAVLAAMLLAAPAPAAEVWQGQRAAFLGVTFRDTSHEGQLGGPRADETARVAMVQDYLAGALAAQGLVLVDLEPVRGELDLIANPADCYGCDVRMARRLGARYAVVSEIQKVSNLILVMNVALRDAATGAQLRARSVDIRGNTDESWLRGIRYLLNNGIFRDD